MNANEDKLMIHVAASDSIRTSIVQVSNTIIELLEADNDVSQDVVSHLIEASKVMLLALTILNSNVKRLR